MSATGETRTSKAQHRVMATDDPYGVPHMRGPAVDQFMACYWNEGDEFDSISQAALKFRRSEHPMANERLRGEMQALLNEQAFPETLTEETREALSKRFPTHHRFVTRGKAAALLASLG